MRIIKFWHRWQESLSDRALLLFDTSYCCSYTSNSLSAWAFLGFTWHGHTWETCSNFSPIRNALHSCDRISACGFLVSRGFTWETCSAVALSNPSNTFLLVRASPWTIRANLFRASLVLTVQQEISLAVPSMTLVVACDMPATIQFLCSELCVYSQWRV